MVRTSEESWERAGWRGKLALHALSTLGAAVSIGAVAWASGGDPRYLSLIPVAVVGGVVAALPFRRRPRLSFVIYPAALFAALTMRAELLGVLAGGSLFALAKLLAIIQAMASFNLRSLRSLYDSLLLGLAVILLVSEAALSPDFALFLLVFGVIAVLFLATAHPVGEAHASQLTIAANVAGLAAPVVGVLLLTSAVSVGVFLAVPQTHRISAVAPLPSRLDVTVGRPPRPLDLGAGDPAVSAEILPSRSGPEEGGADQGSAATSGDERQPATGPGGARPTGSTAVSEGTAGGGASPGRIAAELLEGTGAVGGAATGGGITALPGTRSLESYANLGYVGPDEKDVVMYVRSPLASYWRGEVLDVYDGRGWKLGAKNSYQLEEDMWGRLRFTDAPKASLIGARYVQSFFPQVEQPYAVFTGYQPGYVTLQDPARNGNRFQRIQENIRRLRSESYRVVSFVPDLRPDALVRDSADRAYLGRMPTVPARVQDLADAIVDGSTSDFQVAARLERYLLDNYSYDLRVPPVSRSGDAVETFLFDRQAGYCAQFATTMAVMARLVGLPARVALGYMPGRYNSLTGAHSVRLQDAHAWVEIKFKHHGWVPFDPTPRPDSPWALDPGFGTATESLQQVLRERLKDVALGAPSAAAGAIGGLVSGPGAGPASILAAVLAAMVGLALWTRRRPHTRRRAPAGYTLLSGTERHDVKRVYDRSLRVLKRKGYPSRLAHQSPNEYATALAAHGHPVPEQFLHLSRQASHALCDPRPLELTTGKQLQRMLRSLRKVGKLRSR